MLRLLLVMLLFGLPVVSVFAQEDTWPIEDRCATYASIDAWTYDGTILMTGYGGLHGVNADWETPRVLVFTLRNGILSPNGNWYAGLDEAFYYSETMNHFHDIMGILVYSTRGDNLMYSIPWENSWLTNWGAREFFWLDNEHLLYEHSEDYVHGLDELVSINPFDNLVTPWEAGIDILQVPSFPSPDFTRTVLFRYPQTAILYDVASGDGLVRFQIPLYKLNLTWSLDSHLFVAEVLENDQDLLALFDKNGQRLDTIAKFDIATGLSWSSDGRYLAFHSHHGSLLLADMQQRRIFDTCISTVRSLAWSPAGSQLAFLEPGTGTKNVYVLDIQSWSYRSVARHIIETDWLDYLIGWREN